MKLQNEQGNEIVMPASLYQFDKTCFRDLIKTFTMLSSVLGICLFFCCQLVFVSTLTVMHVYAFEFRSIIRFSHEISLFCCRKVCKNDSFCSQNFT